MMLVQKLPGLVLQSRTPPMHSCPDISIYRYKATLVDTFLTVAKLYKQSPDKVFLIPTKTKPKKKVTR